MKTGAVRRVAIVEAARDWIGTPYRHQGSTRNVGCDCLGLVRGVWRHIYGEEAEQPGPYQPDWAEMTSAERLIAAGRRHCGPPLPAAEMQPGDIIAFRWRAHLPAKHVGIVSAADRFIHAYEQACVIESPLIPAWRRRIAAVFRFPGVVD
ncbi:NlpC/P60 family protein [Pararhizobium haloflavum]|uniref:NlpC/P60 family protein n=1 Tax=Pararhizobium haloflavum TaxID=2037914 RepID=UPI000C19DCDD|nr:NlpC/P60 family protein [Pararhizobium haloflavum]